MHGRNHRGYEGGFVGVDALQLGEESLPFWSDDDVHAYQLAQRLEGLLAGLIFLFPEVADADCDFERAWVC